MILSNHGVIQSGKSLGVVDPFFSNVPLLLHPTGSINSQVFVDTSSYARNITTFGDTKIITDSSSVNGKSINFDGLGDYLTVADSLSLRLGTSVFTIELSFSSTASNLFSCLVSNELNNPSGYGFTILLNNGVTDGSVGVYNNGTLVNSSSSNWCDGNQHYLALVRSGSGSSLWIDGTQQGSTNSGESTTSWDAVSPQTWGIGNNLQFSGRIYLGKINEFRITKAVVRDVSTIPTTAFPDN